MLSGHFRLLLLVTTVTLVLSFEYDRHMKFMAKNTYAGHTALDPNGNLYVLSTFDAPPLDIYPFSGEQVTCGAAAQMFSLALTKFSSEGAVEWTVYVNSSAALTANVLLADKFGAPYVGFQVLNPDFNVLGRNQEQILERKMPKHGTTVFLKFSTNGALEWDVLFESIQYQPRAVFTYDGDNSILAGVQFRDNGKISSSKSTNVLWSNSTRNKAHSATVGISLDGTFGDNFVKYESDVAHLILDLAIDPVSKDIIVAGYVDNTNTVYLYFGKDYGLERVITIDRVPIPSSYLVKISANNEIKGLLHFYPNGITRIFALSMSENGQLAILGYGYVDKLNGAGVPLTVTDKQTGSNIIHVRMEQGNGNFQFLMKLDSDMKMIWTNLYPGGTNHRERYYLACDKYNNVYFTANMNNEFVSYVRNGNQMNTTTLVGLDMIANAGLFLFVARNYGKTEIVAAIKGGLFTQMSVDKPSELLYIGGRGWSAAEFTSIQLFNNTLGLLEDVNFNTMLGGFAIFQFSQVNGGWSGWSQFGECDARCPETNGFEWRTRQCDNPPALRGGTECEGNNRESQPCQISCFYPASSGDNLSISSDVYTLSPTVKERYWVYDFGNRDPAQIMEVTIQMPIRNEKNMLRFLGGRPSYVIQSSENTQLKTFQMKVVNPFVVYMKQNVDQEWSITLTFEEQTSTPNPKSDSNDILIATTVSVAVGVVSVIGVLTGLAIHRRRSKQWQTTLLTQADPHLSNDQYVFSTFNESNFSRRPVPPS